MRALSLPLALLLAAPLIACAGVSEAAKGPQLSPVSYPAALASPAQLPPAGPQPPAASANSLWQVGSRTFFKDPRAGKVGDILTVMISIDDSARTQNTTATSRTAGMKAGIPHLFGLETALGRFLPGAFDPASSIETNSTTSSQGAGAVTRAEKINLTVAVIVTNVLPNGNLVIQGTQEVRTNNEVRQLTVTGIVRPEDISAANTINHTQIAEARISYGGRGDVSRVQKTPPGQSLVEKYSPF
ncbi:flagellar L-ring protein precursor FlgH [Caulobacter ginsengisoli]|uniref:Flagellar L-ring protein n=1 Tax=Caulobacter ginsengisoli TaxID=400775 RepID=A0ABU0IK92_9CAUL|nr:flagellar basal body L-ring protein FlgH [Caulobacter ginsengisoli]MDQ0462364.1 flagellar L-ring protein precursor FlgH [Caulobacter ginsengisoli]